MTASSYLDRLQRRIAPPVAARDGGLGRRWHVRGDALIDAHEGIVSPTDIVAVPAEEVLVLAIDLPLSTRRQRLDALPFAIEDRIADPLTAVHLSLGAEIAPQRHLVGVVHHEVMRRWLAILAAGGLERAALVPDALLLPRPAEGGWTIRVDAGRALVRSGDGGGFALQAAQLEAAWSAAGRPQCAVERGTLPDAMLAGAEAIAPGGAGGGTLPLDLRQGDYMVPRRSLSGTGRRVAMIAAAGLLAHGAIALADTLVLHGITADKQAQVRLLVATALPGLVAADDDFVGAAAARLQSAGRRTTPDRLLPLLDQISSALAAAGPVDLRSLSYDRGKNVIAIAINPGGERRIAALLAAAGLPVTTTGVGTLTVRSPTS